MRIFSINFNGGFAIVDNSTTMMNIINSISMRRSSSR